MDLTVFSDELQKLSDLGGHIGAIASAVFLVVRLYRLPDLQPLLPAKVQWDGLPTWLKYAVLAALAAGGGAMMSLAGDKSWVDAGKAAVAALLTAISTDKITTSKAAHAIAGVLVQGVVTPAGTPPVAAPTPLPVAAAPVDAPPPPPPTKTLSP